MSGGGCRVAQFSLPLVVRCSSFGSRKPGFISESRTPTSCNQTKTPPKLCCRNIPAAEVRMYQCAELRIPPTDRATARHWTVQSGHCRDVHRARYRTSDRPDWLHECWDQIGRAHV